MLWWWNDLVYQSFSLDALIRSETCPVVWNRVRSRKMVDGCTLKGLVTSLDANTLLLASIWPFYVHFRKVSVVFLFNSLAVLCRFSPRRAWKDFRVEISSKTVRVEHNILYCRSFITFDSIISERQFPKMFRGFVTFVSWFYGKHAKNFR